MFLFVAQIKAVSLYIIGILTNYLQTGTTVDRLNYLKADILGLGGSLNIADGRVSTLENSIQAIYRNPISGIITKPILHVGNYLQGFGQHSQFLDTTAIFGIIIGILYIYSILYPLYSVIDLKKQQLSLQLSIFFSVIILFTMNNVTPSIGFAIFFIYLYLNDSLSNQLNEIWG